MNDTQDPSTEAPKASPFVRLFLIALPVGLAFMVPISLWIYYVKKYGPKPVISEYAVVLRKDLNTQDFTHYTDVLSKEYGESALPNAHDRLEARARYIESTMDYSNMGYVVQRQVFSADGRSFANLFAELPGRSRSNDVVLVLTEYDGADVRGTAAMMCLAHAMTGLGHAKTIRFAAVANAQDADARVNGLVQLGQEDASGRRVTKTILLLSPMQPLLETHAPPSWKQAKVVSLDQGLTKSPDVSLASLKQILAKIEAAADAP